MIRNAAIYLRILNGFALGLLGFGLRCLRSYIKLKIKTIEIILVYRLNVKEKKNSGINFLKDNFISLINIIKLQSVKHADINNIKILSNIKYIINKIVLKWEILVYIATTIVLDNNIKKITAINSMAR